MHGFDICTDPMMLQARRSLAQFWPHTWDTFHWATFSSPLRLLKVLAMVVVILLVEVNGFFLKYLLWVPPLNPLITYRLILLFLMAVPAVREYYIFLENDEVRCPATRETWHGMTCHWCMQPSCIRIPGDHNEHARVLAEDSGVV